MKGEEKRREESTWEEEVPVNREHKSISINTF